MNRRVVIVRIASALTGAVLPRHASGATQAAVENARPLPFLTLPVSRVEISEGWKYDKELKFHPNIETHHAVDFKAAAGAKVHAAADGWAVASFHTSYLTYEGRQIGYGIGKFVQIAHLLPSSLTPVYSTYCHLQSIDPSVPYIAPVRKGELWSPDIVYEPFETVLQSCKFVRRGQVIGRVGRTGLSDGWIESPDSSPGASWDINHLHFEVFRRGPDGRKSDRYDPYGWYAKSLAYRDGRQGPEGLWLADGERRPLFVD